MVDDHICIRREAMLTTTSINAAMHAPAMSAGFQRPSVAVADAPPSLPLQASSSEMGSYGTLCRSIAAFYSSHHQLPSI